MNKKEHKLYYALPLGVILVFCLILLIFFQPWMQTIEYGLYDYYHSLYTALFTKADKKNNQDILYVEVDSETHRALNSIIIDREVFARLNDIFTECEPALVIYDYIFANTTDSDHLLIDSITPDRYIFPAAISFEKIADMTDIEAGRYQMAQSNTPRIPDDHTQFYHESPYLILPIADLIHGAKTLAHINAFPDGDGVIRRIPLVVKSGGITLPAASLAAYAALTDIEYHALEFTPKGISIPEQDRIIPLNKRGELLINFKQSVGTGFAKISLTTLLKTAERDIDALYDLIEDKIIVVSDTSFVTNDYGKTPIAVTFLKPYLHAFSILTLLSGKFITVVPIVAVMTFLILFMVLMYFSSLFLDSIKFISEVFIIFIVYILVSIVLFCAFSIFLPVFLFTLTFVLSLLSILILKYILEEREKAFIKYAFNCYVPKKVVSQILNNRDLLRLEGKDTFVSILFADIINFTSISETIPAVELVKFLKHYNTEMTRIIKDNDGIIDKYEGDAIMAEFGLPLETQFNKKLSAYHACLSAIKMQERINLFNHEKILEDKPLGIRIGINSGYVIAGNMGSNDLFDYTVIGDEVNLASRLEGANKFYDTKIMIGQKTYELIKDDFITRIVDLIKVKGRKTPERVYELIDIKASGVDESFQEFLSLYETAFHYYSKKKFYEALDYLLKAEQIVPDDSVVATLELKCKKLLEHPPPENWDGVTVLQSK